MNGGINQHDENAFKNTSFINKPFEEFVMNWLSEDNLKHIIHFTLSLFLKNNSGNIELDFIADLSIFHLILLK